MYLEEPRDLLKQQYILLVSRYPEIKNGQIQENRSIYPYKLIAYRIGKIDHMK
jgi:hypothetical protein